jgi:hypothetical protein
MPARKRKRREPTHEWQEIEQLVLWPEQEVYERLRPVILFGQTAAERAKETGTPKRTLQHQAELFEQEGMASLFPKERAPASETSRSLPPEMRQLIVDLKAEHPGFTPHEIATICFLRFERRPSDHTVKRVLAEGPRPSISGRRYPAYAEIADGYKRRRAIVDLHADIRRMISTKQSLISCIEWRDHVRVALLRNRTADPYACVGRPLSLHWGMWLDPS